MPSIETIPTPLPAGSAPAPMQSARRAWAAVVSVALSATVFCTTEFLPVGLLRYISQGLHVSEGIAGIMVSAPGFLAAFAAPALTVAVGRHDRRRVLLALGVLLVASNLMAMFAPNFAVLIAGRVLFGIGLGGFWAIGAGLGGRLVHERSAAQATSIIFAGVSVGMLVGGSAGALIGDMFGWRAAFGVASVLSIIALLAQAAFLPPLRVDQRVRMTDVLGIARTHNGKVGLIAMLFVLCGQFATYTYITPFLASVSAFDGKVISSILLGYTLIGLFGNFLGGAAAGRNVKGALVATVIFFNIPVLMLPLLGASKVATLVLLAVWGTAYGAMPIALQVWMTKAAPNAREGAMALFVANFQISIALGSYVGGLIVDSLGILDAFYIGGTIGTIALIIVGLFGKRI